MKRYSIIIPLVAVGILLAAALRQGAGKAPQKTDVAGAPGQKKMPLVAITPVTTAALERTVNTTGTVVADAEVKLIPKVEQRIVALPVVEGSRVAAGQILARLDSAEAEAQLRQAEAELAVAGATLRDLLAGARPEEIAQARAALRQAQASRRKAEQSLRHARELYGKKGLPAQALDDAEGKVRVATAQVQAAEAAAENARLNHEHAREIYQLDAAPRQQLNEAQGRFDTAVAQRRSAEVAAADAQRDRDRVKELEKIGGASTEQLDKAQARLETAQAQLETVRTAERTAKENLERAREIYQSRVLPKQQRDDAETKYRTAKAQVAAARETEQNARAALEHVRYLHGAAGASRSGPVPQRELDDADSRLTEADAQVQQVEQRLRMLLAGPTATGIQVSREKVAQAETKVAYWRNQLSYCTLTAPSAGVVTAVYARPGDLALTKQPLLALADAGQRIVRAGLPDRDAALLRPGLPVRAEFDALPGKTLSLSLRRVYPAADTKTRLVTVEVGLPGGTDAPRLGTLARLEFVLQRLGNAVVVPSEALVVKPGGRTVAFVVEGEQAHVRPVTTGMEQGDRIQVTAGLSPGEKLVVQGQELLKDGMDVKAKPAGGKGKPGPGGASGAGAGAQGKAAPGAAPGWGADANGLRDAGLAPGSGAGGGGVAPGSGPGSGTGAAGTRPTEGKARP